MSIFDSLVLAFAAFVSSFSFDLDAPLSPVLARTTREGEQPRWALQPGDYIVGVSARSKKIEQGTIAKVVFAGKTRYGWTTAVVFDPNEAPNAQGRYETAQWLSASLIAPYCCFGPEWVGLADEKQLIIEHCDEQVGHVIPSAHLGADGQVRRSWAKMLADEGDIIPKAKSKRSKAAAAGPDGKSLELISKLASRCEAVLARLDEVADERDRAFERIGWFEVREQELVALLSQCQNERDAFEVEADMLNNLVDDLRRKAKTAKVTPADVALLEEPEPAPVEPAIDTPVEPDGDVARDMHGEEAEEGRVPDLSHLFADLR